MQNAPEVEKIHVQKYVSDIIGIADVLQIHGANTAKQWELISNLFNVQPAMSQLFSERYEQLFASITDRFDSKLAELVRNMFVTMLYFMDNITQTTAMPKQKYDLIADQLKKTADIFAQVNERKEMETAIMSQHEYSTQTDMDIDIEPTTTTEMQV